MMDTAESLPPVSPSSRKILIIGDLKSGVDLASLYPHEVLRYRHLEGALEAFTKSRPDLVIYFSKDKEEYLEEHVMTWLIEGFRGKFIVLDPRNRIADWEILLERQVVDEYLSGPISPTRFLALIKSQLTKDVRFASPRAMTTFDLFRNLFDRCLNAIFFFGEDLSRCVTANLRAEQMTGHTLYELRQLGLKDLCSLEKFEETSRVIRRANRNYYDSKGATTLRDRLGRERDVAFSCGVFNFGRKSFVKIEVKDLLEKESRLTALSSSKEHNDHDPLTQVFNQEFFMKAFDQNLLKASKTHRSLSLIDCRIISPPQPLSSAEADQEPTMLRQVAKVLQSNLRQSDIVARLSHYQFAILLPRTPREKAEKLLTRLQNVLKALPFFKKGRFSFRMEMAACPAEAYPVVHLLHSAESSSGLIASGR